MERVGNKAKTAKKKKILATCVPIIDILESLVQLYLFVHIPYVNSTNANDRFSIKKKNKFLEPLLERIALKITKTRLEMTFK